MSKSIASGSDTMLHLFELRSSDVAVTARLHRELLPHGLFPRLGQRFMCQWHETFIAAPNTVALGVRNQQGVIQGFLLATTDERQHSSEVLRQRGRRLAATGAACLLIRPMVLRDFVRTRLVRYVRRLLLRRRAVGPSQPSVTGVLHALACAPSYRGQGAGAAMVREFERRANDRGTPVLQLITRDQGGAASFYETLGWSVTDQRTDRDGHAVVQLGRWLTL